MFIGLVGLRLMRLLLKVVKSSGVVFLVMWVSVSIMLVMMFLVVVGSMILSVISYLGRLRFSFVLCMVSGISLSIFLVVWIMMGIIRKFSVSVLVRLLKWFIVSISSL